MWGPVCHVAALPVARLLLARAADPNVADAEGRTPLHLVLASRLVRDLAPFVALLLAAGAEARVGSHAETYFPPASLGERQLAETIRLLRVSVAR